MGKQGEPSHVTGSFNVVQNRGKAERRREGSFITATIGCTREGARSGQDLPWSCGSAGQVTSKYSPLLY